MAHVALAAAAVAVSYVDARYSILEDLQRGYWYNTAKGEVERSDRDDRVSAYYLFEEQVRLRGSAECYQCDGVSYSWIAVEDQARRLAHHLLSLGLKRGDVVSVFMRNKPQFAIVWLACLSLDIVPAFINYSLVGEGLLHCIATVNSRLVLYDADLAPAIADIASSLAANVLLASWADRFVDASEKAAAVPRSSTITPDTLSHSSNARIQDHCRAGVKLSDPAVLIFTSGTTGLPKAATCTHVKIAIGTRTWTQYHQFNDKSRIYTPMPLYHSTAAILAVATAWKSGSTVIIGRKFSATRDEVRDSNANVIQYVGEVLRYLLATPPSPNDKKHDVKIAYGNGCRPDVWEKFRERFGVPVISEFFGASEANASLFNVNRNALGAGAVGKYGAIGQWKTSKEHVIVRLDPDTEEPTRDAKGFCVRAARGEPGELVTKIQLDAALGGFDGYYGNPEATEKKVLRNVFVKDDAFFRTGDLLSLSKDGYFYFHDRMGDTFRWKGENVATTQVAEALGAVVDEANVYGVQVPCHEGRAGCAAIPASAQFDLAQIASHVSKNLPKYAQPLFVRVVKKWESTGTLKQLKTGLRKEGVDPDNVDGDALYWLQSGQYVPFKQKDWEAVKSGKVKL